MMVYPIDMDDFSNACGNGKYPLASVLKESLSEGGPVSSNIQDWTPEDSGAYLSYNLIILVSTGVVSS